MTRKERIAQLNEIVQKNVVKTITKWQNQLFSLIDTNNK